MRHFLDIEGISYDHLRSIVNEAKSLKAERNSGAPRAYLQGRQLAMVFEKNSTRTRVSFQSAINQLGGSAIVMDGAGTQISRGEPPRDTARVLSRCVDVIMARLMRHEDLKEMAEYATVPVINGLTDHSHPCQALAAIMMFEEKNGPIKDKTLAWFGDANNVLRSFVHAAGPFGFSLRISMPESVLTKKGFDAYVSAGGNVTFAPDPHKAATSADMLITDTWVSMGEEADAADLRALAPYRLDHALLALAADGALISHCLPAKRGQEITEELLEERAEEIFDEAENRLHIQKSILMWCLRAGHSFV
ncbi:MAG: ornithine carbamoyltransferase [Rickettsiales bacterium]